MIIHDRSYAIATCSDVKEICEPLFSNSPLNYFYYTRYYRGGSCFSLNTHQEWHKYFYENNNYPLMEYLNTLPSTYYQTLDGYSTSLAADARNIFHMDHFFAFYEINLNWTDIFGFAAAPEANHMIDFYFKNIEKLKKFFLFFREKAEKLIINAQKLENRLVLDNFSKSSENDMCICQTKSTALSLDHDFALKKYYFTHNGISTYLTQKEVECIKQVMCGKSAKKIGRYLDISYRTVETHLMNAKNRIGCNHKSDLVNIVMQHNL